jgi:hypothetical protein
METRSIKTHIYATVKIPIVVFTDKTYEYLQDRCTTKYEFRSETEIDLSEKSINLEEFIDNIFTPLQFTLPNDSNSTTKSEIPENQGQLLSINNLIPTNKPDNILIPFTVKKNEIINENKKMPLNKTFKQMPVKKSGRYTKRILFQ